MKKDLPKIFKKEIEAQKSNNKKVFFSSELTTPKAKITTDVKETSVEDKIKKLFRSSRYIFNINVLIKTNKKNYETRIAGKVKNSIVTVDNEVIPIVEINDIIIKDRI